MNSGGSNFTTQNILCHTLTADNVISPNVVTPPGATDGSTVTNPTGYDFNFNITVSPHTFILPAGYLKYSFVAYNSGISVNHWIFFLQTSIDFVAHNYNARVYIQNCWNEAELTVANCIPVISAQGESPDFQILGFQFNYSVFGTNTTLSPVGIVQPIMVVIELEPYP